MTRSISKIAAEISQDWKNMYFGAVPYVSAMRKIDSLDEMYIVEPASHIVNGFLANASSWRGETARRIKKELKDMCESHRKDKHSV